MSYPQDPQQQPAWGGPDRPGGGGGPQPPRKHTKRKALGFGCLGVLLLSVLIVIIAVVATNSDDSGTKKDVVTSDDTSSAKPKESPTEGEQKKDEPARSQADVFKECVAKKGTPTEKEAVKHVTKITGADKHNDILDTAEVFTDYTGGIAGAHASDGKLIAAAFASCYESENGLVTVYDKNGDILSNGNY
ncbi:hypothetical protein ABIE67_009584 [Streptomyces sp. V4I8]|uniref:hypothetical protein n=1 Tax=Streptomyces sp. V4I8 TaxID=3156469 RepID=UPI0035128C7D